jgi:hypothetical protein
MLQKTLLILREAIPLGIPVLLENPKTSRLWLVPELQALASQHSASWCQVDYCQYGTPWQKSTYFLTWNCPRLQSALRTCTPHSGRCSASGKHHVVLKGVDPAGVFWTARAQPYPRPMCRTIADAIVSTLLTRLRQEHQ